MTLGAPWLLVALVALAPLLLALALRARWRRAVARRLVGRAWGAPARGRRLLKLGLALGALALLAGAAARPQLGHRKVLLPREGSDVVIALDVSASMLATDIEPNRFERAKVVLDGLLDRLQGDRVGLVVFAGTAGIRFPLTTDLVAARELIRSAAIKEGGLSAGTGLGDGLRVAQTAFPPGEPNRGRVVVLVSDGEDLAGAPRDALRALRDRGVIVHVLALGTEAGGTIVLPRPTGQAGNRATATPATSRADASLLRALASDGKGQYVDANDGDPAALIADAIGRLARTRFESQEGAIPIERFQWLAAPALLLLLLDFLLPESRGRQARGARHNTAAVAAAREREQASA